MGSSVDDLNGDHVTVVVDDELGVRLEVVKRGTGRATCPAERLKWLRVALAWKDLASLAKSKVAA